jgi:hypothetical protein
MSKNLEDKIPTEPNIIEEYFNKDLPKFGLVTEKSVRIFRRDPIDARTAMGLVWKDKEYELWRIDVLSKSLPPYSILDIIKNNIRPIYNKLMYLGFKTKPYDGKLFWETR